eukprot:CAMPEP_0117044352 /NCGR_PEP_ID=MMETSP0472-20121206/30750_1 /TAXON_ID=693140 ORGANISM="Tiarina fusus, Strain LIS" /NCGR_SAMPLE_ID=MMETSP0472 /ASSEMBLY_ACC=CAM_ASM_000603 /LENGTH=96 /DNA_ID=CAMNT_0004756071 /DNA_START=308 /DNA_END=599 /DNA_ORIENTATION=-
MSNNEEPDAGAGVGTASNKLGVAAGAGGRLEVDGESPKISKEATGLILATLQNFDGTVGHAWVAVELEASVLVRVRDGDERLQSLHRRRRRPLPPH